MRNSLWIGLRVCLWIGLTLLGRNAWAADPSVPVVHILATDPCATESGLDSATFTVYRDGPTDAALTVRYWVTGSASNGVDYAALSGEVTIPARASSAPITVQPVDDAQVEGGETVAIFLSQPMVWPPPYLVCWPSFAVGHIEDNEQASTNRAPLVQITNPPDGAILPAESDLRLVARASDPDGRVVSVEFFADGRSLGIARPRPIVVEPVPLPGVDGLNANPAVAMDPVLFPDLVPDPAGGVAGIVIGPLDLFFLSWSNVPPGAHVLTAVATDNAGESVRSEPVPIQVLDVPPQTFISIVATDPVATEPNDAAFLDTATFTVHRTGRTDLPLSVFYQIDGTARNGVDYRELSQTVTFLPGARTAEIVVAPRADRLVEGPETVVLTVVPPPCAAIFPPPPECYQVGSDAAARAVINDNDPVNEAPGVEIVRPLGGSVFLAPADVEIVAQARDADGRVVTVEFFEGLNSLGRVTNDWRSVTTNRPLYALKWPAVGPGRYVLTAVATDDDGAHGRSQPVEITVADVTVRPVVSVGAVDAEAAETTAGTVPNPAVFAVKRTGPVDRDLIVHYSVAGTAINGVDYRLLPGEVRIPAGAEAARIVVEPIDDRLVEGTESVGITIEPPVCIAIFPPPPDCYLVGAENQARAALKDNEVANTNLPPRVALVRPEEGGVFNAPALIGLVAAAGDADGWVRHVEFFAGDVRIGVASNTIPIAADGAVIGIDPILPPDQLFRFVWENVPAGAYALRARATDNRGATSWSEPVRVRVVEDFSLPVVTIEATDAYASESAFIIDPLAVNAADGGVIIGPPIVRPDVAIFTIKRDSGTNHDLTVHYRLSGSASNGVDYAALNGLVTIPAGQLRASVVVMPYEDGLVEGTETVVAELVPIACPAIFPPSPACYQVGDPARAVAFIRDNDAKNQPPKVELVRPENEQLFRPGTDVEIVAQVVDPDGYVSEVEFYANGRLIGRDQQIFLVAPPPGQTQRFSMVWSNVPSGLFELTSQATDSGGAIGRSAPVLIKVVEPCLIPVVSVEAYDPVATEQSPLLAIPPDQGRFRVSRTCSTNADLRVRYEISGTASNSVDYRRLEGVVVIPAGAWSADIVVDPIDDQLVEGTETVVVKLGLAPCAEVDPAGLPRGCYSIGALDSALVRLRDNDEALPRVAIVEPGNGDQFRAGANIPIVVQAVDPDGWIGLVEFYANNRKIGEDRIVFIQAPPPGELQRFALTWTNVPAGRYVLTARATDNQGSSAVSGPVTIEVAAAAGLPVVTIFAVDPLAREGTPENPAMFRIRRTGGTNESLTVRFTVRGTASNGVDYARIPTEVTIPAGRQTIRVPIAPVDDRLNERFETVILRLQESALYTLGRAHAAGALILDNDCPRPDTCALPGRDFHLRRGPDGLLCYRVEVSEDLVKWESVGSNALDDDAVHFVDPDAGDWPRRFYRVVPCPDVEVLTED